MGPGPRAGSDLWGGLGSGHSSALRSASGAALASTGSPEGSLQRIRPILLPVIAPSWGSHWNFTCRAYAGTATVEEWTEPVPSRRAAERE